MQEGKESKENDVMEAEVSPTLVVGDGRFLSRCKGLIHGINTRPLTDCQIRPRKRAIRRGIGRPWILQTMRERALGWSKGPAPSSSPGTARMVVSQAQGTRMLTRWEERHERKSQLTFRQKRRKGGVICWRRSERRCLSWGTGCTKQGEDKSVSGDTRFQWS